MKRGILKLFLFIFACGLFFLSACGPSVKDNIDQLPFSPADFESNLRGKKTKLFLLKNEAGMLVALTNYGAKVVAIYAPDRNMQMADVVLGFGSIEDYRKYSAGYGAVVGPYANRIAGASFVLDGIRFQLPVNNGIACLHSGPDSWYRQVWDYREEGNSVVFSLVSEDGEWGFPGNKKVEVRYELTVGNELKIHYWVTTDKACPINVTNHSFFNLKGEGEGNILDHEVTIFASRVTPVGSDMIPTGEIIDVRGTALDFTSPHRIGERINSGDPQLVFANGYDFNYVLNKKPGELSLAAAAYEPASGRYLEVFTTEPGLQFYSGNFLKGTEIGKSGKAYAQHDGFCFETQHFPDSPNQPAFPNTVLQPGDTLRSTTIFKFSVR